MSKRSDKMYADSPRIEEGEDGKKTITKGAKKSAEVNAGTDGIKELELHQKHSKERLELHHKHEKEHMELHGKQMKDAAKVHDAGDGEGKINKIEKDTKEGE